MLKAGIIGLGHGSRVLIDAFRLNNIEVYGIASKKYSKAKKICKEKEISKTYPTWRKLVDDTKIDIVAIAVPPYLQIDILKECLIKNKSVLCEKPLGIDIKKINNFFLHIKKKHKFFFIDYIFPEHEAFKKFYNIINKKILFKNDNITVDFNTQTYVNKNKIINWKSDTSKGGGIINLYLSHIIDYLIWFFGKIDNVNCKIIVKGKREIFANCLIIFKSNIKVKIFINTNNPIKSHSIKVSSKKYQLILRNSGNDYSKNFKIYYKRNRKNNKNSLVNISFKNYVSKFKGDSRILLTSRIIKKLKKEVNKTNQTINTKRYQYNELILNCIRNSVKRNRTIRVYEYS